jgi:class 3 adenylate cyclase/tetratricopeptide (TPR) repeat protein
MMTESVILDNFTSYVPALILRRLAVDPSPLPLPHADKFPGAVLFADISGFTSLTERLAEQGPLGVEKLTAMLNDYFGQIIKVVIAHGGDVVKFAGDALLALWQVDETSDDLVEVTLRASQCALAIQVALAAYRTTSETPLALRVAVASGHLRSIHLGGVFGRCEFVLSGEPLAQVGEVCKHAGLGEVVLPMTAWSVVHGRCAGDPLDTGPVRLSEVLTRLTPQPLRLPPLNREAAAAVRGYIPAAVRSRLEAGQTGWLSELRQITVLFLNLPDLDYNTPLEHAQNAMRELQQALYRYEGSINKLSVDDKGVTLIAALGLPPLAHENDPIRGVRAALAMRAKLGALGWTCSIGVATGRAFCGAYGSPVRREYTMIGDVVNLSARLMQAAHGEVLCSEATHRAARNRLHFDTLSPIAVKGKTGLVPVYRACGGAEKETASTQHALVGRKAEQSALLERLRSLQGIGTYQPDARARDAHRLSPIVIEGEAGIGKSRLVAEMLAQASGTGVTVLTGTADAVEKATPYYAWRAVFQQLLHLDGVPDDPEAIHQHILKQLESDAELPRMAPLLAVIVKGDWPDNDFTAQMTGEVRADNTNRLLIRLLNDAAATAPLLLILEDGHWLDSASWTLLRLVARRVGPLLLVLTTRPVGEAPPAEYAPLKQDPGTLWLRLEGLSLEETETLMCHRLGVRTLPAEVPRLVHEKAQGNPLFSEELSSALRESGLIEIAEQECRVVPGAGDLRALNIPNTVQGVVTSRIDRLTPPQQLTIKVASVIGRAFSVQLLSDVYPIVADRENLPEVLFDLERLELIRREAEDAEPAFTFKHVITLEVVYDLMLQSQRGQLHQEVARWYEREYADDLAPHYPLLAYHWAKAASDLKALDYFEKAGEQALHSHANEEAIGFFNEGVRLADLHPEESTITRPRRASWQRQLGEAYYELGNMGRSLGHFQAALTLLGYSVPGSSWRLALQAMRELARQLLHRTWPSWFLGRKQQSRDTLLEAARAYERLAQIHYLNDAKIACFHAAFRTLNLAESAGVSPELARAYANAAVLFGLMSLNGVARAHARRAEETARQVNQLPCSTYVFEVVGVYWYAAGEWEKALTALGEARVLAEQIGDMRRWDEILFPWSMIPYHRGDFARSAESAAQMYESARRRGIVQVQSWGLSWQLASLLPLKRDEPKTAARIEELILALESLLAEHSSQTGALVRADEVLAHGLLARARWLRGEKELAKREAETAHEIGSGSDPTSHYVLAGYAGMAEVYLGLWQDGVKEMASRAEAVCKVLHTFARMHPMGYAQAWLYQGRAYWLRGKQRAARKSWNRSLAAAKQLGMPHDQELAERELSRAEGK